MDKRLASLFVALITCLFLNTKIKAQGTVTDIDGNTYQTVVIGSQEWMAEDLKVTKYRNGDAILTDQSHNQWQQSTEGIWTYYDNDPANNDLYGKLYNWYATVDSRGLCPTGWRTPTDNDWQILEEFIDPTDRGNKNEVGKKLKSKRQVNSPFGGEYNTTEHPRWDDHPVNFGTDEYNFNSLPGGGYTNGNAFRHKGQEAYYWSSTEAQNSHAWTRILTFSNLGTSRGQLQKSLGSSVRCIKGDDQSIQVPQVNTLPASNISTNSVTCEGEVFSDGGAAVTERGIVWSTNQNPNIDNNQGITNEGSGLGNFLSEISGLNPGTTYWVRAYATNSEGTGYGVQIKLVTLTSIGIPTVSTSQVNNTTSSAAVSGGNVISEGGATVTSRGIVWSTSQNPSLETNEGFTTDGSGAGVFYSSLSNLTPQTVYYVKAYATNSEGTSYGNEVSFETTEEVVVTTNTIIVNDTSAALGNEITIEVEMENQSDIVAFQMDFVLPEGFSYVDGSYTLSNRSQEHTPGQSILTGNVLRVLAYSAVNNTFTGNSGILFTFELATPQTVGTWELNATNVNLTNTDFENVFDEAQSGTITLYESSPNGQPCPGIPTVTDIDGNVYNTVQIGDQCWMKENLKTTHYKDGSEIPTNYDNTTWSNLTEGAYDIYQNSLIYGLNSDPEVLNAYGALYNWYAVNDSRGLCPTGWYIPATFEWNIMINYLKNQYNLSNFPSDINGVGNNLKSCLQVNSPLGGSWATTNHPRWNENNTHYGKDQFGFSALPGGTRVYTGSFYQIGEYGYWWSTSEYSINFSNVASISSSNGFIYIGNGNKESAFSVRCIKETGTQNPYYNLNTSAQPETLGTTTGDGSYTRSTKIQLNANANPGYRFVNWSIDEQTMSYQSNYTYTMPSNNVNIIANFGVETSVNDGQPCSDTPLVTDIDGNTYNTVQIGDQCWFKENLKTFHYNDGSPISGDLDNAEWQSAIYGAYSIFDYNQAYGINSYEEMLANYGALYNWYAVSDTRNVCPTGWHVPTDNEISDLTYYIGGLIGTSIFIKEIGISHWSLPNTDANNFFGFTAIGGGYRYSSGGYNGINSDGRFWSSSDFDNGLAKCFGASCNTRNIFRGNGEKNSGISVRCIKD